MISFGIARTIKNGESSMTDNLLRTMAIITDVSAADNINAMWATVITGIIVVFLILAVLIGLLYVISFFSNLGNKKKKEKKTAAPPATVPVPAPIEVVEEDEDDAEIIAVISAAIAAYTAGDGKSYAIKKIKRAEKQPRSSWGNAGVNENTRPF